MFWTLLVLSLLIANGAGMGMGMTSSESLFVALFSSFVGIVDSACCSYSLWHWLRLFSFRMTAMTAHIEHCGGGKDSKIN
jgi:hypothetical protein